MGGCANLGLVKARNEVIYLNIVEFNKCTDIKIGTPFIETEIKYPVSGMTLLYEEFHGDNMIQC